LSVKDVLCLLVIQLVAKHRPYSYTLPLIYTVTLLTAHNDDDSECTHTQKL